MRSRRYVGLTNLFFFLIVCWTWRLEEGNCRLSQPFSFIWWTNRQKFRVGEIHGRPTRSEICVGHGPHGSGAYGCELCAPACGCEDLFKIWRTPLTD